MLCNKPLQTAVVSIENIFFFSFSLGEALFQTGSNWAWPGFSGLGSSYLTLAYESNLVQVCLGIRGQSYMDHAIFMAAQCSIR